MPTETDAPTPTIEEAYALALDAKAAADAAEKKADAAIAASERANAAVAGLAHAVARTTNEVLGLKQTQSEHHTETLAAIEGARKAVAARERADSTHDAEIAEIKTQLSTRDMAKVGGAAAGGVGALGVLGLAVAGLIQAITPAAPDVVRAQWGQPGTATPIVVYAAPSSLPLALPSASAVRPEPPVTP